MSITVVSLILTGISLLLLGYCAFRLQKSSQLNAHLETLLAHQQQQPQLFTSEINKLQTSLLQQGHEQQLQGMNHQQQQLKTGLEQLQNQLLAVLTQHSQQTDKSVDQLTTTVEKKLQRITEQVHERLTQGFDKTTATFADVQKRLALIDQAQQKITELSGNIVSLQDILADKRSRGAFGEVQLTAIVNNLIPASHVKFQHTLSNQKRVDCLLLMPEPTGAVAVDAKFPLETYRSMQQLPAGDPHQKVLSQQFRQDIKKHITDIAEKYILPPETADGAIMFIPAEAIFAEIHSNYPELVEQASAQKSG